MKKAFLTLSLLLLIGCGYQPTNSYVKRVIGERIYISVSIFVEEPENAVLILDTLKEALKTKLKVSFTDSRESADSELDIVIKDLRFKPLQYNDKGYVVMYRNEITLKTKLKYRDRNGVEKIRYYDLDGFYDFPVSESTSISEAIRFDAIKFSSQKALDTLIPKLAYKGSRYVQ
jgi:hypothetical protein